MLIKSRDRSWSAGHGDAHTTVRLLATGKKGTHSGFLMKSSFKGWSTRCVRNRQSSDDALLRLVCAEEAMRARRSYGGGVEKTEEEKGDERRRHKLYMTTMKQEEAMMRPSPC